MPRPEKRLGAAGEGRGLLTRTGSRLDGRRFLLAVGVTGPAAAVLADPWACALPFKAAWLGALGEMLTVVGAYALMLTLVLASEVDEMDTRASPGAGPLLVLAALLSVSPSTRMLPCALT